MTMRVFTTFTSDLMAAGFSVCQLLSSVALYFIIENRVGVAESAACVVGTFLVSAFSIFSLQYIGTITVASLELLTKWKCGRLVLDSGGKPSDEQLREWQIERRVYKSLRSAKFPLSVLVVSSVTSLVWADTVIDKTILLILTF